MEEITNKAKDRRNANLMMKGKSSNVLKEEIKTHA
jgi:hypothetical protein